jgi:hypothetical protein
MGGRGRALDIVFVEPWHLSRPGVSLPNRQRTNSFTTANVRNLPTIFIAQRNRTPPEGWNWVIPPGRKN